MSPAAAMERQALEARENEQELLLALATRLRQGDSDAFAELVRRFQKRIFSLAYGFFREREEALDIVQETFMRVYEKIDFFRPEQSLSSWLYRLAYNLCVDHYRKHGKRRKLRDDIESVPARCLAHNEGSQALWESRSSAEAIEQAAQGLSRKQREVFVLKYRQGLKLHQVADAMAISIGTVKALHHRAIHRIRREVAPGAGG
ncbi:MAG: RNA polymerase sigma factor [Candidatus Aminicenantes bacterium]|nr:RNA polymerase sigma factor [Candidatus Aminicenantes bacterium]